MARGRLRYVLLCEDLRHERLLLPILEARFGRPRKVERQGSFAFVLKQLPIELRYVRQNHQEAVALVVVVDGDRKGFIERLREVRKAGRLNDEAWEKHVALCIPTRNVETWILWLTGSSEVDEQTDYKRQVDAESDEGIARTRDAAHAWATADAERRSLEGDRLPALVHARKEIDRLSRFARP